MPKPHLMLLAITPELRQNNRARFVDMTRAKGYAVTDL